MGHIQETYYWNGCYMDWQNPARMRKTILQGFLKFMPVTILQAHHSRQRCIRPESHWFTMRSALEAITFLVEVSTTFAADLVPASEESTGLKDPK